MIEKYYDAVIYRIMSEKYKKDPLDIHNLNHFIDYAWEVDSIIGVGRGSATCYLSNYLLGITQLDPVVEELPLWRSK